MRGQSVIGGLGSMTIVRGPMPLPCPGSIGQQPAALMDAFAMLDSWTQKS